MYSSRKYIMLATESEAEQEWVIVVGAQNTEQAWILSPRDVWYKNPFYLGPRRNHPEDIDYDD